MDFALGAVAGHDLSFFLVNLLVRARISRLYAG